MWDFSVGRAMGLMMQTLPFVVLRIGVYFGITLAYILATGAGAGIGFEGHFAKTEKELKKMLREKPDLMSLLWQKILEKSFG